MPDVNRNRKLVGVAFTQGSDEILGTIRQYLRRFARPWEIDDLAMEVFQETALLLLDPEKKWLALYDEAYSPMAWIKRHAYLQVLSVFRDRKRRWDRMGELDLEAPDAIIDEALQMDCRAAWEVVRTVLGEETFTLLQRVVIEGYSQVEIAREMGVPVGTVNARVSRAKATARELLGNINPFS